MLQVRAVIDGHSWEVVERGIDYVIVTSNRHDRRVGMESGEYWIQQECEEQ